MTLPYLTLITYSFTLWFGLYLVARDATKLGLRYAGFGLISYAFAIAISMFVQDDRVTNAWSYLPILLPSVFWMGAVLYLVPDAPIRPFNLHIVLLMVVLVVLTFGAALIRSELTRFVGLGIPIVFIVGIIVRLRQAYHPDLPRPPLVVLMTASIFFALASGLIVVPVQWLSEEWVVIAISLDLICLGYAVGVVDAYDEGTSMLRDALRSLAACAIAVLIFGGQVIMVMAITDDASSAMLLLLFGLITTVLVAITFYDDFQTLLDQLVIERADVRHQRDDLRAASRGLARATTTGIWVDVDESEFIRWTRRALSHYGDLNKLAASPLLQLPLVEAEADDDNVLARANALKTLLRDGIEQLKPADGVDFSQTDEWRYYNVLYYPYIVGLKPYSSRFYRDDLSPAESDALEWFRTYVPERTLYNWQRTAAELVANHLREQVQNRS